MPNNPPEDMPRVTPLLIYDDVAAATAWLERVFGFNERMRIPGPDGVVIHSEVEIGDGVVMLGVTGEREDSKNPQALKGVSSTVYVYVDDVDKHFDAAKRAGATILSEPETKFWGDRTYDADDLEGHRWLFAQRVQDTSAGQ